MSKQGARGKKQDQTSRAEGRIRKLSGDKRQLMGQIEGLTNDLKRAHADFVNYKRRTQADQSQIMTTAKQAVVNRFLPLLDNLERATSQVPKEIKSHSWVKGVAQSVKQIQALLNELGVEKIPAVGEEFDPNLHEAMSFEDGQGKKELIVEEIQTGYKMGNQIIRPSLVKVKK